MTWLTKEQVGHICIIRLLRPEVYHALNRPLLKQLSALLDEIAQDDHTRTLIITSSSDKAFSSGADLKERQSMTEDEVRAYLTLIRQTFAKIENFPMPVIAAVSGVALGGGMELALSCDFRIADETASFALPETSLGIIPGAGGTQRLRRIAGITLAKELIFSAKRITAKEAFLNGIISKVTGTGQALKESILFAERITCHAPLAIKQAKKAINEGYSQPWVDALELESSAYEQLIPTKDRLEGLRAFREKRKPHYRGE
jgi:enoyl-CoA hydratase/carnithine racemase